MGFRPIRARAGSYLYFNPWYNTRKRCITGMKLCTWITSFGLTIEANRFKMFGDATPCLICITLFLMTSVLRLMFSLP